MAMVELVGGAVGIEALAENEDVVTADGAEGVGKDSYGLEENVGIVTGGLAWKGGRLLAFVESAQSTWPESGDSYQWSCRQSSRQGGRWAGNHCPWRLMSIIACQPYALCCTVVR
jgi:hypothetical protein